MRQLLPEPAVDIDVYECCRPGAAGPLLRLNFVASLDGSVTDGAGRSGGLGGDGDRALFRALRANADAILVGAGTVRVEGYRPHRLSAALRSRRQADGRDGPAAIVVVSRSLELDPDAELFASAVTPTIVLTCAAAPADRVRALSGPAEVVVAGDGEVDLAAGLTQLHARGLTSVLCEGGPQLAEGLLDAGLVDELFLTFSPMLVGTGGVRLVERLRDRIDADLVGLLAEASELCARYRL